MTLEEIRATLAWCSVINIGLLLWWILIIIFARDWVYRWHSKWFNIPVEKFDTIHYTGITFFKISVFLFNLVPYFALRIVG